MTTDQPILEVATQRGAIAKMIRGSILFYVSTLGGGYHGFVSFMTERACTRNIVFSLHETTARAITVLGVYEHRQGVQTSLHSRKTVNVRWTANA